MEDYNPYGINDFLKMMLEVNDDEEAEDTMLVLTIDSKKGE
jgi:hypothetical protein